MTGRSITLRALREHDGADVPPRLGLRVAAAFVALQVLLLLLLVPANAAPVTGTVLVQNQNGYTRLIFTLSEDTESEVRLTNGIVVVAFKRAVDIQINKIPPSAPGYIGAARIDPDGTAIRLALMRKVTVNSMAAGEKLFVDLLPEGWTGLAPGLPQEVVDELSRRARDAEKTARQRLQAAQQRALPPVRVRVGNLPTFTRYTFPLPALIPVSSQRADDGLTLKFEAPLKFDLADVQALLPPMVAGIEIAGDKENSALRFAFIGKVDVRTFREDNSFMLDVLPLVDGDKTEASKPTDVAAVAAALRAQNPLPPKPAAEPVETKPAKPDPAHAEPEKPAAPAAQPAPKPQASPTPAPAPAKPQAAAPQTAPAQPQTYTVASEPAKDEPAPAAPAATEAAKPAPKPVAGRPETTRPVVRTDPSMPVVADVRRQGDAVRLTFAFDEPTPAAVFRRGDTIRLVFDTQVAIDTSRIVAQSGQIIRSASLARSGEGQIVMLKVDRPKLTSLGADGNQWSVVIGDMMTEPTQPLTVVRTGHGPGRSAITVPFMEPRTLHRIEDAEIGDTLLVVTAHGPARGFVKPQDFVEFNALASAHGIVLQPRADDVSVELTADKVVIGRPGGLVLSSASARPSPARGERRGGATGAAAIDPQTWGFDRESKFAERQDQLMGNAAMAPDNQRTAARLDLARFYLANNMGPEAKGVLDTLAGDDRAGAPDPTAFVLRSIANIMLGRGKEALTDLGQRGVSNRSDAILWRALAQVQLGQYREAREGLQTVEATTTVLPLELQRFAFQEAVRAAVEVQDFASATNLLNEFDTLGASPERDTDLMILRGRVMEGIGRVPDALNFYRTAVESLDRPAAMRATLRQIALRQSIADIPREEAIVALEGLTAAWRGDETETEALQLLGRFYAEAGRYRDAFQIMRTALTVFPNSHLTRKIQDEAAVAFEALYLGGKGDAMPAIDALSLFYDYRELTPVGRRGDEMIRKLADRLVSIDLLDQAAELLQHQVDHRLQGAARSQVAVRLAIIYLIARKPDRAIQALRATRSADLPAELRNQRLLIEARALSDSGRPEVALEVIAGMPGREIERMRADILWKARRWREAGEQIERYYGERWRDFAPLSEPERADLMRGAIAYALGEDMIGLDRFRTKYAPKMADSPDRRSFDVVTTPANTNGQEFADIARQVGASDTLEAFLRDIRTRFPDTTGPSAGARPAPARPPVPERGAAIGAGRAG